MRPANVNNNTKESTIPAGIAIWSIPGAAFGSGNVRYVMAKPKSSTSSETTIPSPVVVPMCGDVEWSDITGSKTILEYVLLAGAFEASEPFIAESALY